MGNYECAFSQSESRKYFEWTIRPLKWQLRQDSLTADVVKPGSLYLQPITATASSIYISMITSSLLFDLGSLPYCIESLTARNSDDTKLKMELKNYLMNGLNQKSLTRHQLLLWLTAAFLDDGMNLLIALRISSNMQWPLVTETLEKWHLQNDAWAL